MANVQGQIIGEEDDEEVEHEWLDEHPIEEVVITQDGHQDQEYVDIDMQHLPMEYEEIDSYPSLLPVRDGIPLLTLNLPDLMSKTISFTNGEKMSLCFNKRCQRQVAFEGFLYTIVGYVSESMWNVWTCVNPLCDGSIRSSPSFQELRVRTDHTSDCLQDEMQIRLRVAVYDLRLMAEFTDLSLDVLHAGFESRMKTDNPDIQFPSFEALKNTLEDHRINKIYRKRFEMQALKDKQKKMNMTPDESDLNAPNHFHRQFAMIVASN
ncbi:unnamed protein product [Caenorhabditis angaria]|uniref:Uncharacterized protein n=1 Tax=Caenorhabditis angaria TaxID=860376 RepID=A0A9P1I8Z1_9PELO|nr:unnamed protein product [Caenorhabditis angaria]